MAYYSKNTVCLINPPPVKYSYRQIYPSLPILAAALDKAGFNSKQLELNNEFYDWLYGSPNLSKILNRSKLMLSALKRQRVGKLRHQEIDYLTAGIKYIREYIRHGHDGELPLQLHYMLELGERYPRTPQALLRMMQSGDEFQELVKKFYRSYFKVHDIGTPLFIGISVAMLVQLIPSLLLARWIKEHLSRNVPIVMGGAIPTLLSEEWRAVISDVSGIDIICSGEGEDAIVELAKTYAGRRSDKRVVSDLHRSDGHADVVNVHKPLKSLNCMTVPLYDRKAIKRWKLRRLSVLVGRGCYWGRCAYCEYQGLYRGVKVRNPRLVVNDIEQLLGEHGILEYEFICDTMEPEYAKTLSRKIIKRDLGIRWISYLRVDSGYGDDLFSLMKRSGCNILTIGLESIDDEVLKNIQKGYSSKTALSFLSRALNSGINIQINMIIDLPGTSYKSALRQYDILRKLIIGRRNNGAVRVVVYRLDVTDTTKLGMHPDKYGIILKSLPRNCRGDRANLIYFRDPKGMTAKEKNRIETLYIDLNNEIVDVGAR